MKHVTLKMEIDRNCLNPDESSKLQCDDFIGFREREEEERETANGCGERQAMKGRVFKLLGFVVHMIFNLKTG